jgi:hypothetical protein
MSRSDQELKVIANDIYTHKVFTDKHINPSEYSNMVTSVFMPLIFMNENDTPEFKTTRNGRKIRNKGHMTNWHTIFEYYGGNTTGQAINGYPTFMSLQWLDFTDGPRMWEEYNKICLLNNKPKLSMKVDYRTRDEMLHGKAKSFTSDKKKSHKARYSPEAGFYDMVDEFKGYAANDIPPNSKKAKHMSNHRKRPHHEDTS